MPCNFKNHVRVLVIEISYKSKENRVVIIIKNWLELTTVKNEYTNLKQG